MCTRSDGNSFENGPAPPSPPHTGPPPRKSNSHHPPESGSHKTHASKSDNVAADSQKGLSSGAIIGIILGASFLVVVLIALALFIWKHKTKGKSVRATNGNPPLGTNNGEFPQSLSLSLSLSVCLCVCV